MPTIIEIDSPEHEIQSAPTVDTSIIKPENKEGEKMGERDEVAKTDEMRNQEELARHEKMLLRRNEIQEEKRTMQREERQRHNSNFYVDAN